MHIKILRLIFRNYVKLYKPKLILDSYLGKINDLKMILKDGSRIVGKEAYREGKLDLINKGVYSPCESKIKIKNFICPIWQLESEKMIHDRDKLFIYNKHVKMQTTHNI